MQVITFDMKAKGHSMGLRFGGGALEQGVVVPDGAGHIPALADLGPLAELHTPQPMPASPPAGMGMPAWQPPPPQPAGGVDVAALASSIMSQMQRQNPPS